MGLPCRDYPMEKDPSTAGRMLLRMMLLCACCYGCGRQPAGETDMIHANRELPWKAVWVWGIPRGTQKDAADFITRSKALGFNVVIGHGSDEFTKALVYTAHKEGLQAYLDLNPIYGEWGWKKVPQVNVPEDCLQEYPGAEVERLNNPTDPDLVAYKGPFLCIDRPEVHQYAAALAAHLARTYRPDGIALDFIGYKNYRGCRCSYSNAKRAEFAAAHPQMEPEEVEKQFSLSMITALYAKVRSEVTSAAPGTALHCHAYPPFDPEPLYANRLPVEFPAQTVAWYFKPHWPMEKVAAVCRSIKADEHRYHRFVTATAFVALSTEENARKSPERLREEIRAVKDAGINAIMIGGPASFMTDDGLAHVISEELGGTHHAAPPNAVPEGQ